MTEKAMASGRVGVDVKVVEGQASEIAISPDFHDVVLGDSGTRSKTR